MNNDPVYQRLRELAWRRKLTEAEQAELRAWLAAHPEAQADFELEAALSDALTKLPDVPMPSNFNAIVLRDIDRDAMRPERRRDWSWVWRVLVPRTAVATLVVGTGILFYHRHAQQSAIAKSIVAVNEVKSLPSLDALENFDVIRKLDSATPSPDEDLLALMQ